MAVKKKNGNWYIYFRPFKDKLVGVKLDVKTKSEGKQCEAMLLRACRSGDYRSLDSVAREACIRMFLNQRWELPHDLDITARPKKELTLWQACEFFKKYPEISSCRGLWRYKSALLNLTEKLGKDTPIKEIKVPSLKKYRLDRLKAGAKPATVNREMSTLSRLFGVLMEMELIEINPVRQIKRLSEKSGERQVYLSLHDVNLIADRCPEWYQFVIWTAYYTGMRRSEIFGLTRKQINLTERMITLSPDDTKEAHWKRVPIHRDLVPYLKEALRLASLSSEKVFLVRDGQGVRELGKDTFKNPWPRACKALEDAELLKKPFPHFHDLRHTWKTNARRSGMDFEIRESILGHWFKEKSVSERYGRISNEDLLKAIDVMTFDHGATEIHVAVG